MKDDSTRHCDCNGCRNIIGERNDAGLSYCTPCGAGRFVPNHPGCDHTSKFHREGSVNV